MDRKANAERVLAAMDFCGKSSVCYKTFHWLDVEQCPNFKHLVMRTGSKPKAVAEAVWKLFDAGHIARVPEGTPPPEGQTLLVGRRAVMQIEDAEVIADV